MSLQIVDIRTVAGADLGLTLGLGCRPSRWCLSLLYIIGESSPPPQTHTAKNVLNLIHFFFKISAKSYVCTPRLPREGRSSSYGKSWIRLPYTSENSEKLHENKGESLCSEVQCLEGGVGPGVGVGSCTVRFMSDGHMGPITCEQTE